MQRGRSLGGQAVQPVTSADARRNYRRPHARQSLRPHETIAPAPRILPKVPLLLDRDHAEQAVGVVIWSCSKEEFVGGAVCTGTLAEVQPPKLINRYRRPGCVGQCAEESAA